MESTLPKARRTCSQCKSSKKKCDKSQPKCNRCVRLSLGCSYEDNESTEPESTDTKFENVFRRLERIEARLFPPGPSTGPESTREEEEAVVENALPPTPGTNVETPYKWTLDPGELSPSRVGFLEFGSVFRAMAEGKTSAEVVAKRYFDTMHQWLPMINQTRFMEEMKLLKTIDSSHGFLLTVLAMHLVINPPSERPEAKTIAESRRYRACKYYLGMSVSLAIVDLRVIQAGIIIALFEHTQGIQDAALLTLGVAGRMAYSIGLEDVVSQNINSNPQGIPTDSEEAVYTWWCLQLTDRVLNMPPAKVIRQPVIHDNYFDPSHPLHSISDRNGETPDRATDVNANWRSRFALQFQVVEIVTRVHKLIRGNRHQIEADLTHKVGLILHEIGQLLSRPELQQERIDSCNAEAMLLSASLHLHVWFLIEREPRGGSGTVIVARWVDRMDEILEMVLPRLHNLEKLPPWFISASYQALDARRKLSSTLEDMQNTAAFKILESSAHRYIFSGNYLSSLSLHQPNAETQTP